MDRFWIVAAVLGGTALIASGWAWSSMFPKPREFQYDGETYVWVPDEANVPFFARWYKFGSFEYSDGTAVTDLTTVKLLNEAWLEMWQRARPTWAKPRYSANLYVHR